MAQPFYHLILPFKGPSPATSALPFSPGVPNGSGDLPKEEGDPWGLIQAWILGLMYSL